MNKFKPNWKIFWLTFVPMFITVTLHLLGVSAPALITPINLNYNKIEQEITTKLAEKRNTYALQKPFSFSIVKDSYAQSSEISGAQNATSYAVVDFESGEVIAQKNLSQKLPIASLTKIMTAVVALDLMNPNEVITVTPTATQVVPTKIGVTAGQKMNLTELLNALLLTSANDAAEVIRDGIDAKYGKGTFIKSMNTKAYLLGLKNSHFSNPQGFDSKQNYSTSEDLAILSHYALKNYPLIQDIAKKDYQLIEENGNHKQFALPNWNGLLGVYPEVTGFKIGNTDDAGKTTVVLSNRNNKTILVVLLGAPGVLERDLWAAQLLDMGYNTVLGLAPVGVTEDQLLAKYKTWNFWYQ